MIRPLRDEDIAASRSGFLVVAVLTFVASVGCAWLSQAEKEEALTADEPAKHLGTLRQGQTVGAIFVVTNNFRVPVELKQAIKNCDCTEARFGTMSLGPGEQTTLAVEWQTRSLRGEAVTGISVLFQCHDEPTARKLDFRVGGFVEPDIRYEPGELTFRGGKPSSQRVRFSPGTMASFRLLSVACDQRAFSPRLLDDGHTVEVAFNPAAYPPEKPEVRLLVGTDSPNEPNCRIGIRVDVAASGGHNRDSHSQGVQR